MSTPSAELVLNKNTQDFSLEGNLIGNPQRVADVVEEICQAGCKVVLAKIAELDGGQEIPELQGLCEQDQGIVLDELTSIMSVYGNACRL